MSFFGAPCRLLLVEPPPARRLSFYREAGVVPLYSAAARRALPASGTGGGSLPPPPSFAAALSRMPIYKGMNLEERGMFRRYALFYPEISDFGCGPWVWVAYSKGRVLNIYAEGCATFVLCRCLRVYP